MSVNGTSPYVTTSTKKLALLIALVGAASHTSLIMADGTVRIGIERYRYCDRCTKYYYLINLLKFNVCEK